MVEHSKKLIMEVHDRIEQLQHKSNKESSQLELKVKTIVKLENKGEYFEHDIITKEEPKDFANKIDKSQRINCHICNSSFISNEVLLKHCTVIHYHDELKSFCSENV